MLRQQRSTADKLSGATHNVFGIQVGVAVTFLVRKRKQPALFAEP